MNFFSKKNIWLIFSTLVIISLSSLDNPLDETLTLHQAQNLILELESFAPENCTDDEQFYILQSLAELRLFSENNNILLPDYRSELLEKITLLEKKLLLKTKAARIDAPAFQEQINLSSNSIDTRDVYLRNLLLTGSLILNGQQIGSSIPSNLFVLKAGDSMTGDLTFENQHGVVFDDASNTGSVTITAPPAVSDYTLLLPTTTGNFGYVLAADGNNPSQLSWQPVNAIVTSTINLSGDVTGPANNNTVAFVDGVSAASIASGANAGNLATPADTANRIVLRDGSGDFSAGTITANLSGNATTATTATNFTGPLVGDVTGTQGATHVSTICGVPACTVVQTSSLVLSATSANQCGTLVLRDSNCNFSANTITANLTGTATFATTALTAVTSTSAQFALSALNATTALYVINGGSTGTVTLSGDVIGLSSANTVTLVGGQTATSVANTVTTVNAATSLNTPNTLVKRDASGNFGASSILLTGSLELQGTNGNSVNLAAAPLTNNYALLLPTSTGSSGYVLTTDGNNPSQLSWQPINAVVTATINLSGDVTGPANANTVALVDGVSAASIASGATAANAATNLNTANTIVKRDSSGNFSAGTITANLSGNATNFTGPLAGDVTGTQGATVVVNVGNSATIGSQNALNVANATTTVQQATSADTGSTLVKRDPSGNFAASQITAQNIIVTNPTNQVTLGAAAGPNITLNAATPGSSLVYTIPNTGTNSSFVMTDGNQLINGNKTLSGTTNLSGLTPSLPLQLDGSNNIISAPFSPSAFSGIFTVTQGGTGSSSLGTNAILASNSTGTAIIPLANLTNGQLFIGSTGNAPVANTLTQASPNQVIVTNGAGTITLSTPQDIAPTSSPTFASETLTNPTNQLILGSGNNVTLSAQSLSQSYTYYFPNLSPIGTSTFVMVDGAQTINGLKSFNNSINMLGQNSIDFYNATNSHFVAVRAPLSLSATYSLLLPSAQATSANQALFNDGNGNLSWGSLNPPLYGLTIYVAFDGNDTTGDGSFGNPFRTLGRALLLANPIALGGLPVSIQVGAGLFVEDLSSGPLTVAANPITISGVSNISTLFTAEILTQTFLYLPTTATVQNLAIVKPSTVGIPIAGDLLCGIQADASVSGPAGFANNSVLLNIGVVGCQMAFNLSGGSGTDYFLNGCATENCGFGAIINNARCAFYNTILFGAETSSSIPFPANLGLLVTGPQATLISESTSFLYCATGAQLSEGASTQIIGGSFSGNLIGLICDSSSISEINGTTFILNGYSNPPAFVEGLNIFATGIDTQLQATACNINGILATGPQGIGLLATSGAVVNFSSSSLTNLTDGIISGSPTDTSADAASILATGVTIGLCTDKQIIQNDDSSLAFIGGSFDRSRIAINGSGSTVFNSSDQSSNQATKQRLLGSMLTPLKILFL
jgi:hypothetical protein